MVYYNENDRTAAAWLRQLIAAGHIAHGVVDERSIADVSPGDLRGYTQCHFFAGIGGWSLALRLASWPDDRPVWTGSCPCQPFSAAGKGLGRRDPRHLWPAFRRLINRCRPPIIFGEQVASAAGREWLAGVQSNLERMAYASAAADLCAASVKSPHIRQRLYWMAYNESQGWAGVESERKAGQRKRARAGGGGTNGGVEYAAGDGREQRGAESGGRCAERGRGSGGVDDAASARCYGTVQGAEGEAREQARLCVLDQASGTGGVAYDGGSGSQERAVREGDDEQPAAFGGGAVGGFWDEFDVLPCRDGKARRVEPGSFPLADGVPGRVGLLRGYGNAIVPQLAAQFIQAAESARENQICTMTITPGSHATIQIR